MWGREQTGTDPEKVRGGEGTCLVPGPTGFGEWGEGEGGGLGLLAGVIERMLTVEVPEGQAGEQALELGIQLGRVIHTPGCQSRLSGAELPWSVRARSSPFPHFCYLIVIKEWRETPQSRQFN